MPVVGMDLPRAHLTLGNGIPGDLRPGKEGGTRIGDRRSVRRKKTVAEKSRSKERHVRAKALQDRRCRSRRKQLTEAGLFVELKKKKKEAPRAVACPGPARTSLPA